jgi:lipopolysaccharide export system protein LptC
MAKQYTIIINLVKRVLGIIVILLIFGVFAFPWFSNKSERVSLKNSTVGVIDQGANTVVNPKLYGKDNKGRPYILSAEYGTQSGSQQLHLYKVESKLYLNEKNSYSLAANHGEAFENSSIIHLKENVVLSSDDGYTAKTEDAFVDYKELSAFGKSSILLTLGFNKLKADSFKVLAGAEIYKFYGNVIVLIKP